MYHLKNSDFFGLKSSTHFFHYTTSVLKCKQKQSGVSWLLGKLEFTIYSYSFQTCRYMLVLIRLP